MTWGGWEIEARPGTEKRCSHSLQSGPAKAWTVVFVMIYISDLAINLFACILSGESKQ